MTGVTANITLTHSHGLAVERFDDALLIWDEDGRKLHRLDQPAASVWDEMDGRSLGVIAAMLKQRGIDVEKELKR